MKKLNFLFLTLAVLMAVFSSTAAMGQQSMVQPEQDGGIITQTAANQNPTTQTTTTQKKKNPLADIDWLKELTSRIELHGYAQAGYSYDNATDKTNSTFNLKRTLFWAKARITDRWYFLFMHDFNSVVQEFYTDYRITNNKALTVRLGQFKNSFSLENPMSPTQLELIDVCSQSVTNLSGCYDPLYGLNYGRDIGLMIYGDLFKDKLHYELALMNGQGINKKDGNSDKDVILKLEYKPIEHLRFVVSGQKGRGHAVGTAEWNPDIHEGDDYRRDRISAGAEWKSDNLSVRAEYLAGKDGDVTSQGAYMTACVPLVKNLDAIASVDFFDRNTKMEYDQTNATAGLQYWFYKKCRVQLQYTRCWRQFAKDYNWLQAQVQVAF